VKTTKAIEDVIAERDRQKTVEGWSEAHDNEHALGEMALAGACYALQFALPKPGPNKLWPWDRKWWKPKEPRRDLVRAAALILAEIERLDRLAAPIQGVEAQAPGGGA
jgi:hypothetical protein